jgi:uncharacterized membrane protein HdeD (DUF308 family)
MAGTTHPSPVGQAGSSWEQNVDAVAVRQSRAALFLLGATSVVFGALALFWPKATVSVIAVLFGIQLLVLGVVRIVQSFAVSEVKVGVRILLIILGLISMVVGVLCLRHPLQTVTILAALLGLFWLVGGVIDIIRAVSDHSGLEALVGVLGAVAGLVVLAWPQPTVLVISVVFGIWLLAFGVLMVVAGVREGRRATA